MGVFPHRSVSRFEAGKAQPRNNMCGTDREPYDISDGRYFGGLSLIPPLEH